MSFNWITPKVKQVWVSSSPLINKIGTGMVHGSFSYLQAAIRAPDSTLKMDLHTSSWLSASLGISAIFGFSLVSIMMDRFGRRATFLALTVPGVIGMILLGCTNNITLMFYGRLLCGITTGSTSNVGAIVIGEYTCPENRGLLLIMKGPCFNIGSLICVVLGHFFKNWRIVTLISVIPFILSLIITCSWPESPFWLAEKKMFKKSEEAFYWLRGKSEDSTRELKELLQSQRDKENIHRKEKQCTEQCVALLKKFKNKNFQKPAFIITICNFLSEVSGRHILPNNIVIFVEEMTSGIFDPFYYSIIITLIVTLSGTISAILIRTIGVRKLLFTTGTAAVIVLLLGCFLLYLVSGGVISNSYAWLPLFLYVAFFFLSNLGCISVPLVLLGELFPLEHKAFGCAISGYSLCLFFSLLSKLIPYMITQFMFYGTFAILAVCIALSLVILYFMLPETKNRTLQEIEHYFNHGEFRDADVVKIDNHNVEMVNEKCIPLIPLKITKESTLRGV